jgi:hypothetical protein
MIDGHDKELLDEIFNVQSPTTKSESDKWAYGASNYKPFITQFRECRKDGNLFVERCNACGHELLMCKKYGGQCISSKCKDSRIRPGGKNQCTLF